ncbi:reverse transcriptase [Trichonephila clavipes]|nr:reverse transcriptase [Trichonephila clavipes]
MCNSDYHYDGVILDVCEAIAHLHSTEVAPSKVIFFIHSQAANLALSSNTPSDCLNTFQCRPKTVELISYDWTVALQWVPRHVGIPDNDRADQNAKQGAESSQPEVPLTFRRAKSIIFKFVDKYTIVAQKINCLGKSWKNSGHCGINSEAPGDSRGCCSNSPNHRSCRMDGDPLLQCTGLDEYQTEEIVSRYWEARRQMIKKPSTGVG